MRFLLAIGVVVGCTGPSGDGPVAAEPPPPPVNVLVILADDLGTDVLSVYGEHPHQPPTPTIDALAADGVRFDSFYASAVCSPTRAMLQTGRTSRRHGVGAAIHPLGNDHELPLEEVTLPEMLARAETTWETALIGKWHLSSFESPNVLGNPGLQGYGHHEGMLGNLIFSWFTQGKTNDYFHWEKDDNGTLVEVDAYAPTVLVDDTLAWLDGLPSPWLTVLAFNTPHSPAHVPPAHLHDYDDLTGASPPYEKHRAMVQALDSEMGRLLDAIDPQVLERTLIVFLSDNGTDLPMIVEPFDAARGKGTMYEGGVRVPMIVSGPLVGASGTTSDALLHVVDIFPTVAELAGVDVSDLELDGTSLLPWIREPDTPSAREFVFTERFRDDEAPPHFDAEDHQMVRDARYKLIRGSDIPDELFDLDSSDIDEGADLLAGELDSQQLAAFERLDAELRRTLSELGAR